MLSANITKAVRKAAYRRDGFRCALCDSTDGLQIHHAVPRGKGGSSYVHNLITLCWRCHAMAHGTNVYDNPDFDAADIEQAAVEYLADYYADLGFVWNPWAQTTDTIAGGGG